MSQRHADIWSHLGHYLAAPYIWPWSPNGHSHGHEWPTSTSFVQCQYKVKIMAKVKPDGHI